MDQYHYSSFVHEKPGMQRVLAFVWGVLLLLICNIVGTFPRVAEAGVSALFLPSVEGVVLFGLYLLATTRRRWLSVSASVLVMIVSTVLLLFGFGEFVTRLIYQRGFDPWVDIAFISVGLDLLFAGVSNHAELYEIVAIILFFVLAAGISYLTLYAARRILRSIRKTALAGFAALLPISIVVLFLAPGPPMAARIAAHLRPPPMEELSSPDVAPPPAVEAAQAAAEESAASRRYRFEGIKDANVLLFFFESYGYTAYSRDALYAPIAPLLADLEVKLAGDGFGIASSFIESPVSGGFSWIAESTLLTGLWIDSQASYDDLMANDVPSIPRILNDGGYHTLVAMPAVTKGDWSEGINFYSYDDHLYARDFDYVGPVFSYVAVPDQFAIWKTERRIEAFRRQSDRPVYAQFVLVSSHAPFSIIPEMVEPWDRLGDGSIYDTLPKQTFDNGWFQGKQYDEGYVASLKYVLEAIGEYLLKYIDDDSIIIVVGDHQPKRPVREADAPKSVPIHIITRQRSAIQYFIDNGYTPGIIPRAEPPHKKMSSFFRLFAGLLTGLHPEG